MTAIKDDFYDAINGDWVQNATIPADRPVTGGFIDLNQDIEDEERRVLQTIHDGKQIAPDLLKEFVQFHKMTANWQQREADGVQPLVDVLKPLKALKSWSDLQQHWSDLIQNAYTTPLSYGVAPDFKQADFNELWLSAPQLILPDTTSYADDNPQRDILLNVWRDMIRQLLLATGCDQEWAQHIVDQALAFDRLIAQYKMSNEAASDYWQLYHPKQLSELSQSVVDVDLKTILTSLLGQTPEKIIVSDQPFWEHANEVYRAQHFDMIKAWMIAQAAYETAPFLTNELRILAGTYRRTLTGTAQAPDQNKAAYRQAHLFFADQVGLWYGKTYFGEKAKSDVIKMVETMIGVYQQRFTTNTWLTQETLRKAAQKLSALTIHVGYPDKLPEYLAQRQVDSTQDIMGNIMQFAKAAVAYSLGQWHKAPDRNIWQMPADLVNAYYDPMHNEIVFPAAILQAPFYSLEQTPSQNFGGIGTVIAHEVTHAFDTNGARFDEKGNLNEWWVASDFENFEERTKKVEQQFDGLMIGETKINGHLTLSENVADLGGLSAALAAAKQDVAFDATQFFMNYAKIWRQKAKPEYTAMLAAMDVHAPARLRVNVQVKNFDTFFDIFHVTEKDGMWRSPKDRVQIW